MKLACALLFVGFVACDRGDDRGSILPLPPTPDGDCQCSCNPLTQGGCNPNERCTWINDQDDPPIAHVGCAPDPGASGIAIGGACTEGPAGPMGYDACAKGSVCASGTCKQICDNGGGPPTCDQSSVCMTHAGLFEIAGATVAGVCDPVMR